MGNYKEELSSNGGSGTYANTSGLWPKALVGHVASPAPLIVARRSHYTASKLICTYLECSSYSIWGRGITVKR